MKINLAIIFIVSLMGCTQPKKKDFVVCYVEALEMILENNKYLLYSPPSPNSENKKEDRCFQVLNEFYDLSIAEIKDKSIDIAMFKKVSTTDIAVREVIRENKNLSKSELVDLEINDKIGLENYIAAETRDHKNYGGIIVLGKPYIKGDHENRDILIPISILKSGFAKNFVASVKLRGDYIEIVEELELERRMQ